MWPFKKRENKPSEPTWKDLAVKRMKEWRPIGGSFQYLGRECIVTGYYEYEFHGLGAYCLVKLKADYADDLGRIRQISFDWSEAQAIIERNP